MMGNHHLATVAYWLHVDKFYFKHNIEHLKKFTFLKIKMVRYQSSYMQLIIFPSKPVYPTLTFNRRKYRFS